MALRRGLDRVVAQARRWRLNGTTYPSDRAPEGAERLRERLPRVRELLAGLLVPWSAQLLNPKKGDVLVVRGQIRSVRLADLQRRWRSAGGSTIVLLPRSCRVHMEPRAAFREDKGYEGEESGSRLFSGLPEEGCRR